MPIRLAIAGAGRMGQAIERLAAEHPDVEQTCVWRRGDDLSFAAADVVVDFSLPEATEAVTAACREAAKPLVCGVSGLGDDQLAALGALSERVAVLYDRNMSTGVTLLDAAIGELGRSLGAGFDVRIEETHHVHKKDSPSGTALKLGQRLVDSGAVDAHEDIDYHSERTGEVPGDHSLILSSEFETLTLSHSVTSRDVFAEGAIRAAIWLAQGREPGLYSMRNVVFAKK